jgi:hypothetical protein
MQHDDDVPSLLRVLCAGCQGPDTVEIYALQLDPHGEPRAEQQNRVNGMPVGVTDERWPVDEDGRRYGHVCTFDLATMPALAAAEPGVRAAVLFVCDPARECGGNDPHFVHRWVMLSEREVARGVVATPGLPAWASEDRETARPFSVEPHRVPRAVFTELREREERRVTSIRNILLGIHGRAGGGAVHVRKGAWWPADAFFVQIDSMFGGLNLGVNGFAYADRESMTWYEDG